MRLGADDFVENTPRAVEMSATIYFAVKISVDVFVNKENTCLAIKFTLFYSVNPNPDMYFSTEYY